MRKNLKENQHHIQNRNYLSPEYNVSDIEQVLRKNPKLDASHIEVTVEGRVLLLRGTVEDEESAREAERCVDGYPGIDIVRNELSFKKIN